MADGRATQGNVISNRYELEGRLGSGGMSSVYKATDRVLERTVAVKVLAEHLSDDEKFVARFRREALAVAKLIHPNIVQVFDTGVDAGRHYIVMEYVQGRSGAQLLQAGREITPIQSVEIGAQACAGLEYAHRQGIIHRDVKPGNLMVIGGPAGNGDSGRGEMTVKLTDFGIARATEQTRLTQVGSVVGTAAYLAPEQARGEEAAPASDVYALGVVIYQLLTGRLPYEGSSLAELAIRRENERPLPPTAYNDAVPETLSAAVLRALENDPAERFGTARSLADGLRAGLAGHDPATVDSEAPTAFVGDAPTDATRTLPRTDEEPATPVSPGPPPRPAQRAPRPVIQPAGKRRTSAGSVVRWILIGVLIFLVIAIVVGLIALSNDSGGGGDIQVDEVIEQEVDQQIQKLEDFIDQNTAPE
jgi:eukaryotic-like serine/threonine-protein kinase